MTHSFSLPPQRHYPIANGRIVNSFRKKCASAVGGGRRPECPESEVDGVFRPPPEPSLEPFNTAA